MATGDKQLADQLDITRKLAAATAQMAANSRAASQSHDLQIDKVRELAEALTGVSTEHARDEMTSLEGEVRRASQEMVDSMGSAKTATGGLQGRLTALGQQLDRKFPKSVAIGAAAMTGFAQGIKNVVAIGRASASMFTGMVGWIADVSAAIIAIPFKVFQGLITMAQNVNGMDELRQAIENVRKEFGALKGPAASTILDLSRSMKGFEKTGLSSFQVFGKLSERIDYLRELAVAMGPVFSLLTAEFRDNGGTLLAYQKGLGLSNELMRSMGDVALASGRKLGSFLNENTKYALELGRAFQLDSKLISRDMAKAFADVKHFAGATTKQIAEASVYARKLGLDLEKITGTLDAFETFDSAAENAAKLGQSFGVMVDSFELMNAQDPATQLELLRKQLAGAGVDSSNMTRQQLKLLAQTTGLDEATAKMAFSLKNQGVALSDVQKKGGEAERRSLTQTEAMSKLADAIERLVRSGNAMQGGFFDMFIKGFLGGVQASKEFWSIMMNIRNSLRVVYMEGVKLGRTFVQVFPGIKETLSGIGAFFEPRKFRVLAAQVRGVFERFFSDLTSTSGPASFDNLMKRLRASFFDFFNKEAPEGQKMLSGFSKITEAISKIVAGGLSWIATQVSDGIRLVSEFVSGKRKIEGVGDAAGNGLGFLGGIIAPIAQALADSWPAFRDAAFDLLASIGRRIVTYLASPEFMQVVKPAWPILAGLLFGPALTRALVTAATASIAKAAVTTLSGGGPLAGLRSATGAVDAAGSKVSAVGRSGAGVQALDAAGAQSKAAQGAVSGAQGWGVKDAVRLGLKLVAIAGALAVGGVMLALSVREIVGILGDVDQKRSVAAMIAMGGIIAATLPLLLGVKLASTIGKPAEVLKGGLVVGLLAGLVGGVTFLVTKLLDGVKPEQMSATGDIMLKMSLVFLAMVPLLAASTLIGALMTGPQGALVGVLAAGGFAALALAVGAMAQTTTEIVKEIAALRIDSTFKAKSDAFLGIMQSIQAFADTFVRIAEASRPSFLEIISGSGSSFADNVDSVSALVETIIRGRDGRGGIRSIMAIVSGIVSSFGVAKPASLEAAKVFTDVMTGLVGLVQAITPPPEYFAASTDFIEQMGEGDSFERIGTQVARYAGIMTGNAVKVAATVSEMVKKLAAIDVPKDRIEGLKVVSEIFSALAGIMKSVMPSPEAIKSFVTTTKTVTPFIDPVTQEVKRLDAVALDSFVTTSFDKLKVLLPTLTGGLVRDLVTAAVALRPEELERVKAVVGVFGSIAGLIGSVAEASKALSAGSDVPPEAAFIADRATTITTALADLGSAMPALATALMSAVKAVPPGEGFTRGLSTLKALIEVAGEIPKLAASIKTAFDSSTTGTPITPESMNATLVGLTSYAGFLVEATSSIKVGAITTGLRAVGDMVKAANQLDAALSDGNVAKLNVAAKLSNVAKAVGLGGAAKYTITNKNVVVQIDLTVTMKADEVERVILQRKTSVIRDRLNSAAYEGSSKPSPIPDNPSSPSPALTQ